MISTDEQLSSAADRLGVELDDLRSVLRTRIILPSSDSKYDSDISTIDNSMVRSDVIDNAYNQSLFAICERAFGDSPSHGTSCSPASPAPLSPAVLSSTQRADNNSPASASSSAAATQQQSKSKVEVEILPGSYENIVSSEDDSVPSRLQSGKQTREITKADQSQRCMPDQSRRASSPPHRSPPRSTSKTPSHSPPTTPIGHILAFAHGQQASLTEVAGPNGQTALRKMCKLSIIPGCDEYSEVCLYRYIAALFKAHLNLVQTLPKHQNESATNLDALKCDITESSWSAIFSGTLESGSESGGLAERCPPIIRNSVDLFKFTYRLVDKMPSNSDLLTRGFLEGLYASGTPKLVASLATILLSRWSEVWQKESSCQAPCRLLEWCVRLLIGFIVYELSPVSQYRDMKNSASDAFVVFNLGKEGLPPLWVVVDYCFRFASSRQIGKDCKLALCELVQAYLIWSTSRKPEECAQAQLWRETEEERRKYLDALVGKEAFWTIVVQYTLQHVKKLPQLSDSCFEYTFLSALVSLREAKRALFDDKQDKSKRMLLNVMIRTLELMNRDLLSCFVEAEEHRRLFPGIQTSIDFVRGLMESAAVQREILSADPATKSSFLSSLEALITNSAKVIRSSLGVDEAMEYARKGPFSKMSDRGLDEADPEHGDSQQTGTKKGGSEQMGGINQSLARGKAVAFAAILIGYLGKSVENGSWDMSQMNCIKALFHARINSSRTRHRLWNDICKIQRNVEKKIGTQELLSTPERNNFAMVAEIVRKHAACDSVDRSSGLPSHESSGGSQVISTARETNDVSACLPSVWDVPELQHSVCSPQGYTHFDNDRNVLIFMKDVLTEKGQQTLARYDPESPFTVKWIRLQRRNAYIGRARDLLDNADRTVGQRCSCVPGYPKENANGNESRVACSNDLCENRHMKIECAPGKCGSGSYCMNQRMQNLEYAKFKMVPFPEKGVGIVADEDIPEGALVGEYQGEVVTMEEYERRVQEYEGERHFYFMTLTNKLVIDASRKSQATRFLNHSCDPNSETQKWNADGEPRVGIFTKRPISKGEEITFDYGARSLTQYSAKCLCGAKNCRGLLAVRKETGSPKNSMQETPATSGDRTESMRETVSKSPRRKQRRLLEEEHRDSIVKEKIKTAKRYMHEANELSRKAAEKPPLQRDREFTNDMQQKLKLWKASMSRTAVNSTVPDKGFEDSREEVRFPRIPRRSVLRAKDDKHESQKSRDNSTDRNISTRRISGSTDADSVAVAQNAQSSTASRRGSSAGRWALFEETVAGKHGGSQTPLKRPAEADSVRRSSKIPRAGFLPTTSKLKRRPVRPKVAKRKRTRDLDDNDSMGEYSTASEAEPIVDEPVTSPSKLPDGNGACSDDEFIAAPPVESIRLSPARRRLSHSNYERRGYDERHLSRGEVDREGERTRQGRKPRFGSSHGLAWNISDPNLQLHVRSGHGAQSPRAHERLGPMRADFRDVAVHGIDQSGPTTDRRRYGGYRHDRSPAEERYRRPNTGKPEKKRGVHALEEVSDAKRLRIVSSDRSLGRNMHESGFVQPRSTYPESVEASKLHTAERRQIGNAPSLRHVDDDHDKPHTGPDDMVRPILTKLGSANWDFRSRAQMDIVRRENRRKDDLRRSVLGGAQPAPDQPYHDISDRTRFSHPVTSQNIDNLEGPRGEHKQTYPTKKETHWMSSRRPEDRNRADLREFLRRRPPAKKR